jgi:pimeloyl-ACP methyl ester carboxylesterase
MKLLVNGLKLLGAAICVIFAVALVFLYKSDIPADVVDAKYTSPESRFLVTSTGARVHYRDQGNKNGVPIVLVHGSNASLHTWEPWVSRLDDDYRLVSMDLPGHGLTGRTPDDDYSSEAFIRVVDEVVAHLEMDRFVLGGNSMGGGVTWRYTLQYPEKVLAMVLVNASGPYDWWREREQLEAQKDQEQDEQQVRAGPMAFRLLSYAWFRAISRNLDPYSLVEQGVRSAYNDSPVINDALIMRYYELSLREGTRDATMKRFAAIRGDGDAPAVDLSVITQPTLIMWGDEDALISVDVAHRFADVLPDSTLAIYEGIGHVPMEELADRSAEDVREFLSGL